MPGNTLPAVYRTASTLPDAQLGFTDGAQGERQVWREYRQANPFNGGLGLGYRYGYGTGSADGFTAAARNPYNRESAPAAEIATDLLLSDPIIATLVENLTTQAIGEGLTLSSKVSAKKLGITADEARDLSAAIETGFAEWAGNARECHLQGTHNLHALAVAGFASYLVTGELVATFHRQRCADAVTVSKVALRASHEIARDRNGQGEDPHGKWFTFQGVHMDGTGRVRGYWLRTPVAGRQYLQVEPAFVPVSTPWGRPLIAHLYDLRLPGQYRGVSPLAVALTPAKEKNVLQEYTLSKALIHTAFAMTVESDLGSTAAFDKLDTTPRDVFGAVVDCRNNWYGKQQVKIAPGILNHMAPGDKLNMHTTNAPGDTYDPFDKSLARSAAKAAGSSYEETSGDFAKTSFSASRLALALPHRINLRRRAAIAARFYAAALRVFLEEAIATGAIAVPSNAAPFWEVPEAYCAGKWLGKGMVQPDEKKNAEAIILKIENGLMSHAEALAEDGLDFEETMQAIAYEREYKRSLGLPVNEPGAVTTQRRLTEELPPDEKDDD